MRRCIFRLSSRPVGGDDVVDETRTTEINEKQTPKRRDWSTIFLTLVRFLQLAYFTFSYCTLFGFQRSSYFREDGPWHRSPDQRHGSMRMMRWVRSQVFMVLMYHTIVLVVPALYRVLKATRRPSVGLATLFGDGAAIVALLNSIALLDSAHENYCHGPSAKSGFHDNDTFSFGRAGHVNRHRSVCRSLDVVFGLGGLIILSYLPSVIITIWRARQPQSASAKVQEAVDVEQGIAERPRRVEEPSSQASPQRQHSPPPPYHPVVPELAQEPTTGTGHPARISTSSRRLSSVSTTSSLGLDAYLVSDGWRAPEEPPEYSSRPPSLHNTLP